MKQFEYDPATLTAEQLEAIEKAKKFHDEAIAELQRQEDQRMENYYNCIDDYSWGGLCSKANAMARNRADQGLRERIEEIVRGGFLLQERKQNVLRSIETGEIVAVGTYNGDYGRYFRVEEGDSVKFVGCAKQVKTYEKKGYTPIVQTIVEKVVRDGVWRKSGDTRYKVLETVSVSEEVSTEIQY